MKSALNRILIVLPLLLFAVTSCKDDDEQPIPQAISISPNAGLPGSTAIIQGAQFSAEKSDNVVTFNGKIASINQATAVQLDVVVPADAGTGPVAVVISVKGKVASSQLIYSVLPLNTTVTSIAPMKGGFNTLVTITGSNFDAVAVNNIVTFNGVQGTVQSATATSLTVRVPAKAGTGAVVVNGSTPGPTFTYTPEIYVVGYEGQAGKYWKNGVAIPWSLPGKYVYFTGIAVVGNDVHVSGTEIKKNGSWVATYWKNGVAVAMADSIRSTDVRAIEVVGNDVYLTGNQTNPSFKFVATYWKNGSPVALTNGAYNAFTSDITVVGSDVYAAGNHVTPTGYSAASYWKNGTEVSLTQGTNRNGDAAGIAVVGNDVYVAGYETNASAKSVAKYWKNGVENILTDGTRNAYGRGIMIVGSDVYVVGYETNMNGFGVAKYWKNSNEVVLTDGSHQASAYSIEVIDDDVYVTGIERNGEGLDVSKYWKNGNPVVLSDAAVTTAALGISVQ